MIEVDCIPIRNLYRSDDNEFMVWACKPIGKDNEKVKVSKYKTFTVAGKGLSFLREEKRVGLMLEKSKDERYDCSYTVAGLKGIAIVDGEVTISQDDEFQFLKQFMSERQAESVNNAYPDFIQRILSGQEDTIDVKNIKHVGKKLFAKYVEDIKSKCNGFYMMSETMKYGIKDFDCAMKAGEIYKYPENFSHCINEDPYDVYGKVTPWSFARIDKAVCYHFPELKESEVRCIAVCNYFLKQNEQDGDTRIKAGALASLVTDFDDRLKSFIFSAVTESRSFYYDKESKYVALKSTYEDEKAISEIIKSKINMPKLKMNADEFRRVDDFELTDEQFEILNVVQDYGVCVLNGAAGCVDADTEFFTGNGWKRIAEYQSGDKVLQYNEDGTAELVNPIQYIKKPCNYLWHFETPRSINQTLCENHRIVYHSSGGYLKETDVLTLKKYSDTNKNWSGKFITAFNCEGNGLDMPENQIRLMVSVMAEGHFDKSSKTAWCTIRLKKERKIDRLKKLLNECKIQYKYKIDKFGVSIFKFYAPQRRKIYGDEWWQVNKFQKNIIMDEIVRWDGGAIKSRVNKIEKPCFRTTEKGSADFVQYVFSSSGYQSTICSKVRKNQKTVYMVSTKLNTFSSLCFDTRPDKIKTKFEKVKTTDGYKYCFQVVSGYLVLRRNNCIFITGNCGKSSTTKALVRMIEKTGYSYTLLAPTGISAKILKKTTGREVSTVAMNLTVNASIGKFLIIDESATVGVHTLATLLKKVDDTTRIVFVCDTNQLAPIECGNPIHDIISSGLVPCVTLTKVFRYGKGGIATFSTDARECKDLDFSQKFSDTTMDFLESTDDILEDVVSSYKLGLEKYGKQDILCLCPFNKSSLGSLAINNAIQKAINNGKDTTVSFEKDGISVTLKIGDRVINKKNNYHAQLIDGEDDEGEIFIANGDIGTIIKEEIEYDPEKPDEEIYYGLHIQFDSGLVCFSRKDVKNLLLGYCISCHSSQGCEAPYVIFVASKRHASMLTSNLVYVALSRAKKQLTIIGDGDTINEGVKIKENLLRNTWLKDMMEDNNGYS